MPAARPCLSTTVAGDWNGSYNLSHLFSDGRSNARILFSWRLKARKQIDSFTCTCDRGRRGKKLTKPKGNLPRIAHRRTSKTTSIPSICSWVLLKRMPQSPEFRSMKNSRIHHVGDRSWRSSLFATTPRVQWQNTSTCLPTASIIAWAWSAEHPWVA
jgi:hypothetical protein